MSQYRRIREELLNQVFSKPYAPSNLDDNVSNAGNVIPQKSKDEEIVILSKNSIANKVITNYSSSVGAASDPSNPMRLEYSHSFPIRSFVRRKENYPILKTFLFLFTLRIFGGVGASEGLENVPKIYTEFFSIIQNSVFPAEDVE